MLSQRLKRAWFWQEFWRKEVCRTRSTENPCNHFPYLSLEHLPSPISISAYIVLKSLHYYESLLQCLHKMISCCITTCWYGKQYQNRFCINWVTWPKCCSTTIQLFVKQGFKNQAYVPTYVSVRYEVLYIFFKAATNYPSRIRSHAP
jgi:hypothetical protein